MNISTPRGDYEGMWFGVVLSVNGLELICVVLAARPVTAACVCVSVDLQRLHINGIWNYYLSALWSPTKLFQVRWKHLRVARWFRERDKTPSITVYWVPTNIHSLCCHRPFKNTHPSFIHLLEENAPFLKSSKNKLPHQFIWFNQKQIFVFVYCNSKVRSCCFTRRGPWAAWTVVVTIVKIQSSETTLSSAVKHVGAVQYTKQSCC